MTTTTPNETRKTLKNVLAEEHLLSEGIKDIYEHHLVETSAF